MKAVIALSGLAGFLLFGPNLFHAKHVEHRHLVVLDRDVVAKVAIQTQSQCRFEAERNLSASANLSDLLHVIAGSGSLEVVGVAGLGEVRASARACASHEEFLEELQLTSRLEGSNLYVETGYPDWSEWRGGGERYARLDLRVEVPEGMAADVHDSSGEMALSNLGDVVVDDSSGEIEAYAIRGNIRIDDSSGEIMLRDVTGDVEIEDGSGEIDVSTVGGSVVIEDGSGEISVGDVEGSVRVVEDGSGGIEVDGVGGDFVVERDGSGGIEYRNVTGRVDIPRKRR